MLARGNLAIPAGLPLDQSTRLELLEMGRANRAAFNVRQDERGALSNRLGFAGLPVTRTNASSRSTGARCFDHYGLACVIDGTYLDAYLETPNTNVQRSRVPEMGYELIGIGNPRSALSTASGDYVATDCAVLGSYLVISFHSASIAGPPLVGIYDRETKQQLVAPAQIDLTAGALINLAVFDNRYVAAMVNYGTALRLLLLDTTTLVWGSPVVILSPGVGGLAAICSLGDRVGIAYNVTSGSNRLWLATYDETGLLQTISINTGAVTPAGLDVDGSSAGRFWVVWSEGADVKARASTPTNILAATAAPGVVDSTTLSPSLVWVSESTTVGKARFLAFDYDSTIDFYYTNSGAIETSGGNAQVDATILTGRYDQLIPAAHPFVNGGRHYVAFAEFGPLVGSFMMADWTEGLTIRPVANINPGLSIYVGTSRIVASSTNWVVPIMATIGSSLGSSIGAARIATLSFDATYRWQDVAHADATYLSGGLTSIFDGERVTEVGFLYAPIRINTTVAGTGITGTFSYVAVYEDVDPSGRRVISAVSLPTVRTAANQTVTVRVSMPSLSNRVSRFSTRTLIYRTTNTGTVYYLLAELPNAYSGVHAYADSTSDAALQQNPLLYGSGALPGTGGAAQDRRAPPGFRHIVSCNGMLIGATQTSLFYSGQDVYGEATWFSPAFEVPIPGGGNITGLASSPDGTCTAFKANQVFAATGEPPSDNGLQGGLGQARLIASDVGCIDSRSIVSTSMGVFFQSARGIELLDRGFNVTPIGDPIRPTLNTYPIIVAAVLDDRRSLVRFSCVASESANVVSGNGVELVFDLTIRQWVSTDDKRGASAHQPSQDACMVTVNDARRFAWLGTNGVLYMEKLESDSDAYLDGSTFVVSSYETAPIKTTLGQEQRIFNALLTIERYTACGITVEVSNDHGPFAAITPDKVWSDTVTAGKRKLPFRPKALGESIRLRVSTTAPVSGVGSGRGVSFVGVSIDAAQKTGLSKVETSLRR